MRGNGFQRINLPVDTNRAAQYRQGLFDRVNLATGSLTGTTRFFVNPIGSTVTLIRYETAGSVQKTARDTNLVTQGVDQSKSYSLAGVSMALIPAARTVLSTAVTNGIRRDKDNIREGGYLVFKVVTTPVVETLPLFAIPEMNAESGVSTTANDSTIYAGPAPFGPMYKFGDNVLIQSQTSFSVEVVWDGTITLGQSYDMVIYFHAAMRRPVG